MIKYILGSVSFAAFIVALSSCSPKLYPGTAAPQLYRMDSSRAADSSVVAVYQPYKVQLEAAMSRVVGRSAKPIIAVKGEPETLVANWFADAMMEQGKKLTPQIDFAFGTRDGIRASLPQGNLTVSHVFELMPFENELVLLELSASDANKLAQFLASFPGNPVSGIRFVIKDKKAEQIEIQGKPFDPNKTYKVLTYDYLANGGDNLSFLKDRISYTVLGKKLRDALMENIEAKTAAGQLINAELDGRIRNAGN